MPNAESIDCPPSHPFALDNGLTCCRRAISNAPVTPAILDFFDPLHLCDVGDRQACVKPAAKCSSNLRLRELIKW